MAYKFQPHRMYRMPTHFGPSLGPRQGRDGKRYTNENSPKKTIVSVSFLSDRDQLDALLPEGFEVNGDAIVTVTASYVTDIEWLAGRGYNMLGVTIPTKFRGERDCVEGRFLLVLWENLADPIITGREELGFSKVYCELPELQISSHGYVCRAGWLGFDFLEMRVTNPIPLAGQDIQAYATVEPLLHYKYIPRTGSWGDADARYATMSPAPSTEPTVQAMWRGRGHIEFRRARWEDLPTMFHIVNTLKALEIHEYHSATIKETVGGRDFSDQQILR